MKPGLGGFEMRLKYFKFVLWTVSIWKIMFFFDWDFYFFISFQLKFYIYNHLLLPGLEILNLNIQQTKKVEYRPRNILLKRKENCIKRYFRIRRKNIDFILSENFKKKLWIFLVLYTAQNLWKLKQRIPFLISFFGPKIFI